MPVFGRSFPIKGILTDQVFYGRQYREDNITLPSTDLVGSNEISGTVHYSRDHWHWGTPGVAIEASQLQDYALPVEVRSATGLISIGEPTDAKSAVTDSTSASLISLLKQLSAYAGLSVDGDYETVAASQSDQVLGPTGAAGDVLDSLQIVPASLSPGAVSIKDGAGSAITIFVGGAASVSCLIPFFVSVGMKSANGAWKVTTGADVSVIASGSFT